MSLRDLSRAAAVLTLAWAVLESGSASSADPPPAIEIDFEKDDPALRLVNGAKRIDCPHGGALELATAIQYAEIDVRGKLDGARGATAGGWFFPRRIGEQDFLSRGLPEIAPLGERMFPPRKDWVNLVLGTDEHGFLLGTVHGNGRMPFPYVTLCRVPIGSWSQLVVVKREDGYQDFYRNGELVRTDRDAAAGGAPRPFVDTAPGEPLRIAMPLGGLVGEVWVHAHALSAEEIRADFEAKRSRYHPALPAPVPEILEMDVHPAAGLWQRPPSAESWPGERKRILDGVAKVLGPPPAEKPPLDPRVHSEESLGGYLRRKVSFEAEPGDRMTAWLLVPRGLRGRAPAVICMYGTTGGAGKDTTVGLSGSKPGSPPERNRAFAIDVVEAGLVALAPDWLRDGERVRPGDRPYDSTAFHERHPAWSVVGKDSWDTSRAIDYLETLDFVDAKRIGMMGHSYGGHGTIFAAALDPRIACAVANGPVSEFRQHGIHWGRPPGAGGGEYIRGLRPYVLDHTLPIPVTFYEFTALIAPRPLLVGQAVGERRPLEEENYAAVAEVYRALGAGDRVRYVWYAGDHDFPPEMRREAVRWMRRWLGEEEGK